MQLWSKPPHFFCSETDSQERRIESWIQETDLLAGTSYKAKEPNSQKNKKQSKTVKYTYSQWKYREKRKCVQEIHSLL